MDMPVRTLPPTMIELLKQLPAGETVRFVSESGATEAILVSIRGSMESQSLLEDQSILLEQDTWLQDWQDMAQRIAADWKSDKTAVEIVSELRR